ncbi:hypothetical protein [Bacterioplanoides sp. SCSIO 12839]|uniref:hypothetical protein n=1 Tax=Bacterioplanoides sp. SCSIO 12839 TaxID=2829569 RepID=UPI002106B426|nr:hypothetical protein [Bacterioplanoides sp. SCSIO 12839]UTW47123.1 hypothetical protein KFF03_11035 [Bacterioplanoides sp. SCSIO 12839]
MSNSKENVNDFVGNMSFHEELKLTFDALRNSGLAAGILVVAKYLLENKSILWEVDYLVFTAVGLLIAISFLLQGVNCFSYLVQVESRATHRSLFRIGSAAYIFIMFLIYTSTALSAFSQISGGDG